MKNAVLVVMALAAIAIPARAQATNAAAESPEEMKQDILKIEAMRDKAMLSHDTAFLDRLYSEDLAWTNPSGEVLTKAQVLADLATGKQKFFNINHDQLRFHIYGSTVIVDGRSTSSLQYKDQKMSEQVSRRFVNVYTKENGEWRMIAHEQTVIANPDSAPSK